MYNAYQAIKASLWGVWRQYEAILLKRPLLTNCATCFLFTGLGDVISQTLAPSGFIFFIFIIGLYHIMVL